MKSLIPAILLLLVPLLHAETVIYVSPAGNDAATGQSEAPFQSFGRARDEVRNLKSQGKGGPFVIELAAGVYPVSQTITFGAEDSGTKGAPVTYRSASGRSAVLKGARTIPLSDFQKVTAPPTVRRSARARSHGLPSTCSKKLTGPASGRWIFPQALCLSGRARERPGSWSPSWMSRSSR